MTRPLCFVLMPFGKKTDPLGGGVIDFDRVYEQAIKPAIELAEMDPLRADEERTGGIIHKAMFERLLLCDYAVADLTGANANVFYELGVRHAVRPATTLVLFARPHRPPFDVSYLRALPYELGDGNRFPTEVALSLRNQLTERLRVVRTEARDGTPTDSPLFQLLTNYGAPDIARLKTDIFRDQVEYAARIKAQLARARDSRSVEAIDAIVATIDIPEAEAGVVVDAYLSYRAVSAWSKMCELHDRMPRALQRTVLVREQLGFALNRLGRSAEALRVLEEVERDQGPSSETCGLIGRIYKDLWAASQKAGQTTLALGYLEQAIRAYTRGFEADSRDAYPGINAVTLLELQGTPAALARNQELLPVVRFAVMRRMGSAKPDYWDHATLVELAVLASKPEEARRALAAALAAVREAWEPVTTANNLALLRDARCARGQHEPWLDDIIATLKAAKGPPVTP